MDSQAKDLKLEKYKKRLSQTREEKSAKRARKCKKKKQALKGADLVRILKKSILHFL